MEICHLPGCRTIRNRRSRQRNEDRCHRVVPLSSLLPNPYSHPKSSPFSLSSAWATCAPLCNANYGPIIPGHCQFLWEHKRCAPGIGIEMGITRYKIVSRRENVLSDAYPSGKWARREEWSRSWPGRFGFTLRTGWDRIGSTRVGSVRFSLEWNGVKLVELLGLTARRSAAQISLFVDSDVDGRVRSFKETGD